MRTTPEVTLPLALDRLDPRALPRQVADGLRALVTAGVLAPGEPVPSTRALASARGTSRGTVVAAYDQLLAEGYLAAEPGRGTTVHAGVPAPHPATPAGPGPDAAARRPPRATAPLPDAIDLRPGRPWQNSTVTPAWRAAWRDAAAHPEAPDDTAAGLPAFRAELADHLRRMRGVVRPAEQVFVTAGTREGLALLLEALGRPATVGVEDPGYPSLRRVPARLGATIVPLGVDASGLVTADLPVRGVPDVVLVTPSHQHPLGGSLPAARRRALLEWATAHDVWLVEDDYDSELRYTSEPLPALAALDDPDAGRVVTLGTFAKTLAPGLGAGYLVAPRSLGAVLEATRADLGQPVSVVTQRALAAYLASGALRRHTQRMRTLYRRRRAIVADALAGRPGLRVRGMDGGLHAVIETERDEGDVLADARDAGVLVTGLSSYWAGENAPARSGVVFGFGAVDDDALLRGLAALADACAPRRLTR